MIEIIIFSLDANADNNHNHYLRSGFFEGWVGLRCVFCARENQWKKYPSHFPDKFRGLYIQSYKKLQQHFKTCEFIPNFIRHQLFLTLEVQQRCLIPRPDMWTNSATTIGLSEDSRGVIVVDDWMSFNNQLNTSLPHGDMEEILDIIVGGENTVE